MNLGQFVETTRSFSEDDVAAFIVLASAGACHDRPRTVPEPLIGALFSYLLGVHLPGFGTNYLKQEMRFPAPAPLDTPLTARVEITRLRPQKHLVDLATTCRLADGTLVCEGRALVLARDVGA
ncbi:MAG: phosphate acetyltransferase [Pararhodobacter sp.]